MITSANLYDYFENDLSEIKNIITLNLNNRDSSTSTLLNSLAATEGKMIRAIFTLIGGSFGEIDKSKLYNIAAGIEILHLATLVHDDIIDDSGLRRGKETINITHGAKTALFTGDYLFAQAFILFSESASRESFYNISKTIKFICQSEINQFLSKYSLNSTILDYFRRINGKCASLFSLSLSLGALDGHADDKIINTLKRIGYYVGTAFQLIDDILDITTPNTVLGKPSGNDLFEGIYTFPLLFEIKNKNVKLLSALESNDLSTVSDILKTSDGIRTARKLAEKYTLKALSLIDTLPNSHEKTILKSIIDKLLKREY